MPRTVSRDDIAVRLAGKGWTAEQIQALFLAFDVLKSPGPIYGAQGSAHEVLDMRPEVKKSDVEP